MVGEFLSLTLAGSFILQFDLVMRFTTQSVMVSCRWWRSLYFINAWIRSLFGKLLLVLIFVPLLGFLFWCRCCIASWSAEATRSALFYADSSHSWHCGATASPQLLDFVYLMLDDTHYRYLFAPLPSFTFESLLLLWALLCRFFVRLWLLQNVVPVMTQYYFTQALWVLQQALFIVMFLVVMVSSNLSMLFFWLDSNKGVNLSFHCSQANELIEK